MFDVQPGCLEEGLLNAIITSVHMDKLVAQYKMGSVAYYYKGSGNPENENAIASLLLATPG